MNWDQVSENYETWTPALRTDFHVLAASFDFKQEYVMKLCRKAAIWWYFSAVHVFLVPIWEQRLRVCVCEWEREYLPWGNAFHLVSLFAAWWNPSTFRPCRASLSFRGTCQRMMITLTSKIPSYPKEQDQLSYSPLLPDDFERLSNLLSLFATWTVYFCGLGTLRQCFLQCSWHWGSGLKAELQLCCY